MCTTLLALVSALLVIASAQTQCDELNVLDAPCDSAPEGDLCIAPGEAGTDVDIGLVCGCRQDADCYNNPAYPYCRLTTLAGEGTRKQVCDGCDLLVTSNPATNNADHQFCRNRFPSVYILDPPDRFRDATENVADPDGPFPSSTNFREVCNRNPGNSGSCEPCWQASRVNTPDTAGDYVTYPGFSQQQTRLGQGAIHCRHVYPGGSGSPSAEARPICSYYLGFASFGLATFVTSTTVQLDIARNAGSATKTNEVRPVAGWEGACIPCVLDGVARHRLCNLTNTRAPICSTAGCSACATNDQCGEGNTANCLNDVTCTGGANCMSNGACRNCVNDADCNANDGGAGARNLVCNAASGLCVDPTPCAANSDCPAGQNCFSNGQCRACTSNSDCATLDGPPGNGPSAGQPFCNAGVCEDCATNAQCSGTGAANCQTNGRCANCGQSIVGTVCNSDGGETPGQTVCNTNTQICETACNSNQFCATKGGNDQFTRGANCQANGACRTCTTDATCGALDGGETPGQTTCESGVCVFPFDCEVNADCESPENLGGANCQADNQCVDCSVGYTSSTCGAADGGQTPGQINCNLASRLCVDACNTNADCVGTQGANCMDNGLCLNCRNDADCGEGNAWSGDEGDQRVCTNNICVDACTGNNACPANTNCNNDGRCVACTTDAGCSQNDGPPGAGDNTVCRNGVCIDPFTCTPDAEDNDDCRSETGEANCQADGTCLTCTDNDDCGDLDGGINPGQPRCQADGTCGPCLTNDDCPVSAANCGEDGYCYDCRRAGESCGAPDGGEVANQPNCDSLTGICVAFCTADDQCLDDCLPHCNLNRGCCVECTSDSHCPLENWRGVEANRTQCSSDSVCVVASQCEHDDDCETGACSLSERTCVECVFDSHCSGSTPACATGQQECVECVFDSHCGSGETCGSDNECHDGDDSDAAGVLSFISASLFVVFATILRF